MAGLFGLRRPLPRWQGFLFGVACVGLVFLLWFIVTAGEASEDRILSRTVMPSPGETFGSFKELWFDRALTRNTFTTLRRVMLGFLLAIAVGVPLGVLCGCFTPVQAFFMPLSIFGRNIPLAALIPLTFAFFGIGEMQKVMFIFIASVMFILWDTTTSVREVDQRYVDSAYTLGANRRQVIMKVLVPAAMPSVFNSLRLLFGLAFGYIMLAELVKFGSEAGGLGDIIRQSQRRGIVEHIWLVLIIIPLIALTIDKLLYWAQRSFFPHRYGGSGGLRSALRFMMHGIEDFKGVFFRSKKQADAE
ncbi:MAG: ABC transporter permease [Planctomycetota bacterium]|nr:ABC transporter permease [Planctomycetota bacterium]